jgi:DNA-binding PucR family transcriptional regulator
VELLAPGAMGRAAVATSPEGLAGFATAYQLATRAAETLAPGSRRLVAVGDRIPEVLLAGSPHVLPMLLRETVEPLLGQPGVLSRTLLDTLRALLRHDGSPTHAAEDLFCHRNTVIYRIRQIEQITGRSLADPRDKMLLALGLMAAGQQDPRG